MNDIKSYMNKIEEIAKNTYIMALKVLPPDVKGALKRAYKSETSIKGKVILDTILRNIEIAEDKSMLICQDTGLPVYYVWLDPEIDIGMNDVREAIAGGCSRATREQPLRPNIVHPLTRENSGTNTGVLVPHICFYENKPGERIKITAFPKGSGSENMSAIKMLAPAEGVESVKRFVAECVIEAGAKPCPPTIIGIGIGGTADLCMSLAKKALLRKVGSRSEDPGIAKLEEELFEIINNLGIGPMGLGGNNTVLGVNIEHAFTHISMNPVAVNFQCWAARQKSAWLSKDGTVSYE